MVVDLNKARSHQAAQASPSDEHELVDALRRGEETAFLALVSRYHASMVRVARIYVHDLPIAEEIAQDAWLGVIKGIERFEGRSSLKTWIFSILANCAKTRGQRERRTLPFSDLENGEISTGEPAVDPERFLTAQQSHWVDHWADPPTPWQASPENRVLDHEVLGVIQAGIDRLPSHQRDILVLRDVEGWSSDEVCNVFGLSETNQRVLLHRARSKIRRVLEEYFKAET